ncbi:hypothetical protein BG004_001407 [Podila humilis]|nr:hypothetical protein BG004_001407 [Podila humilis]
MSLKQLPIAQFQLRNPYRLDRPSFDANEVIERAFAEATDSQQRLQQQQAKQDNLCAQRPLPQPSSKSTTHTLGRVAKSATNDESNSVSTSWHGVTSNSIKRIRDFQRRNSLRGNDSAKKLSNAAPTQCDKEAVGAFESSQSYIPHSWLGSGLKRQSSSNTMIPTAAKQVTPLIHPVPTITITQSIDSYAELTFERHVEWLTQTALWWDMPVVHLYPAPEASQSINYIEIAAAQFASWVNFVKVPLGEENKLGPNGTPIKSIAPLPKASKGISKLIVEAKDDNSNVSDCGMVAAKQAQGQQGSEDTLPTLIAGGRDRSIEHMVGYVFVGSVDEQAQYHQVFETMQTLFPLLEIRYINSFEPHQQQSQEQQEWRQDPCIHNLSWIHYWSAAKESQVLQMQSSPAQIEEEEEELDVGECERSEVSFADSAILNKSTGSIYDVFMRDDSDDASLRGFPSTVSVSSIPEMEDMALVSESTHSTQKDEPFADSQDSLVQFQDEATGRCTKAPRGDELVLAEPDQDQDGHRKYQQNQSLMMDDLDHPPKRPLFSRMKSSADVRLTAVCSKSTSDLQNPAYQSLAKSACRRPKKWSDKSSCRRSVSSPILALGHGNKVGEEDEEEERGSGMVSCYTNEFLAQRQETEVASRQRGNTLALPSSSRLGQRLAGFAQKLGVYNMRGSALMVVDL